jgi:ribosomal protein L37AE/L43A
VADGRAALGLYRRVAVAAGVDELVHRMDGVICPVCDRKALARKDGSDYVECRACHNRWHEREYGILIRVYAAEVATQLEASGS